MMLYRSMQNIKERKTPNGDLGRKPLSIFARHQHLLMGSKCIEWSIKFPKITAKVYIAVHKPGTEK